MIGKNPLWLAKQYGDSAQMMLEAYAAETEGAKEADIEAIKQAMQSQGELGVGHGGKPAADLHR